MSSNLIIPFHSQLTNDQLTQLVFLSKSPFYDRSSLSSNSTLACHRPLSL
jgi:hypothetical protein